MWNVSISVTAGSLSHYTPSSISIAFNSLNQPIPALRTGKSVGDRRPQNAQTLNNKNPKRRAFFLDVNPLCYDGAKPSFESFVYWFSLFLSEVSLQDPVIAVLDGDGGGEHRRLMLPSYKAHRRTYKEENSGRVSRWTRYITKILQNCNVPVLKIKGWEADDVIASLVDQILELEFRVVVASPDKDFKQLISEDVQVVMPAPKLGRWSFYTIKHYIGQYSCDPSSDLSLRCILGDEADGVPGIQHLVPGFGRKTALKLLKEHGSLEKLLQVAAVRTVGKQPVQDALLEHGDYLRRNYELLRLRRDVDVHLDERWLVKRDNSNDSAVFSQSGLIQRMKTGGKWKR